MHWLQQLGVKAEGISILKSMGSMCQCPQSLLEQKLVSTLFIEP